MPDFEDDIPFAGYTPLPNHAITRCNEKKPRQALIEGEVRPSRTPRAEHDQTRLTQIH